MHIRILMVLLALGLSLISACSAAAPQPPVQGGGPSDSVRPLPQPAEAPAKPVEATTTTTGDITQRKIVRSGDLSIEVVDPLSVEASVRRIADEVGGYVVSSRTYRTADGNAAEVLLRVPADKFSEAFDRIKALSDRIPKNAQITTQDVTEEYIDLRARLQVLEATHERLLQLLKEAKNVDEALKVEQALKDNEAEIEQIKGRLQFLERSSDFSSIHVQLLPIPPQQVGIQPGVWNPIATLVTAINSYIAVLQAISDAAIYVIIFAGPPAIVLWLVIRTALRRRKVRTVQPQP